MSQQSSIQAWKPFEMVVDTTIAGDSGVGNFKLDLHPSETYRYKVEWGDGTISASTTTTEITHTYPSGGTYTIKIYGRFDQYYCNNTSECDKIIAINSWGNIVWKNFASAFYGSGNLTGITSVPPIMEQMDDRLSSAFRECTNLDFNIGSWDISKTTDIFNLFTNASSFNNGGSSSISGWTINSGATSLSAMFQGSSSFNQPIGSWDVSNITAMNSMFLNAFVFNQDLSTWDVSNVTQMPNMFQNTDQFNQDIGGWDIGNVTNMTAMFQLNGGFNNGGSPSISGWTFNSGLTSMSSVFRGASIFNQPIGSWDVSNVTSFYQMFYQASQFNQDLGSWDVSKAINLSGMFQTAGNFNNSGSTSISGWTTSACTNMSNMFSAANSFNQDIGSWDVSNVTNFYRMFYTMNSFNNGGSPSISGWTINTTNPSGVDMSEMFRANDVFNQDISSWDVSNVTNMTGMFNDAPLFKQPIGVWDVSNVTDMSFMFNAHDTFNEDLSNWDVSNVVDMSSMFNTQSSGGNFNNSGSTSISGWTTSACTNMSSMFLRQINFDQPIGSWDVSNVQDFSNFLGVGVGSTMAFNQDLSSWDVGSCTDLSFMFDGCVNFDQDLSGWNVSGVTDMTSMLDDTNLSVSNYNSILTGWTGWDGTGATKTLVSGVTFGANGLNYSSGTTAEAARNYLTGTTTGLSWTITDGGGI